MHGFTPQGRSRIGLLGGGNEPTAKSGEKTMGPITYNPATGEVTMEASMGSVPDPPPRLGLPPAGYTGPIPIPSGSGAILAQQTAQLQQSLRESGARMTADAAQRNQDLAMAAAQAEQAHQARLQDTVNWHMQAALQRGRQQIAMQQVMAGQMALNAQANQALQAQLEAQRQESAQRVQAIRMQLAAEKEQAGQREQNIQSQLAAVRMKLASVRAQSDPGVLRQAWNKVLGIGQAVGEWIERNENQGVGLGRITDLEVPARLAEIARDNPQKARDIEFARTSFKMMPFPVGGGLKIVGAAARVAPASADFFAGTRYSPKVIDQMKLGEFHAFPEHVTAFQDAGQVTKLTGGDGIVRDMLKIPGEYRGRTGVFEFIKEPDGQISHRMFKPN
jgi:hypothetical protein